MKTYKEWQLEGRNVSRGQRSSGRNSNGEPVFEENQTKSYTRNAVPRARLRGNFGFPACFFECPNR